MPIKIDFSKFDKKLAQIGSELDGITSTAIKETAEQAVKIIVKRTRSKNQDRDGKQFAPYSEQYANLKKRRKSSTKVNLTSTGSRKGGQLQGNQQGGSMMNSIAVERIEDGGNKRVITAARGIELKKLTRHVRGEGRLPKRNPMGFTDAEDKLLSGRASRQIKNKIRKIGRK